jgi:hypothetical protein
MYFYIIQIIETYPESGQVTVYFVDIFFFETYDTAKKMLLVQMSNVIEKVLNYF